MADQPNIRLNKVLRELNISLDRAVEFLNQKGLEVDARPTTKITSEVYSVLLDEFETDKSKKVASHEIGEEKRKEKESLRIIQEKKEQERLDQIAKREELKTNRVAVEKPKMLGKIDLDALNKPAKKVAEKKPEAPPVETPKATEEQPVTAPAVLDEEKKIEVSVAETIESPKEETTEENETLKTQYQKLTGPKKNRPNHQP